MPLLKRVVRSAQKTGTISAVFSLPLESWIDFRVADDCFGKGLPIPLIAISDHILSKQNSNGSWSGLKVIWWHEEREDELRWLLDQGVDGFVLKILNG